MGIELGTSKWRGWTTALKTIRSTLSTGARKSLASKDRSLLRAAKRMERIDKFVRFFGFRTCVICDSYFFPTGSCGWLRYRMRRWNPMLHGYEVNTQYEQVCRECTPIAQRVNETENGVLDLREHFKQQRSQKAAERKRKEEQEG